MSETTATVDLAQKWESLVEATHDFAQAWVIAMTPIIEAIGQFCEAFREIAWEAYLEAGAPYGEIHDGMWRWLRELAKAERLKWEAEQIELRHKQMVDFRNMVREKGK